MVRTQSFALPSLTLNREQLRDLLHIWIVLSMLISTLSPLTTVGVGLPSATASGSTLLAALADLPAQIAPYLPGKAPASALVDPLPTGSESVDAAPGLAAAVVARPDATTAIFSGWPVFAYDQPAIALVEPGKAESVPVAGVGGVDILLGDSQVGNALLPAWLAGNALAEPVLGGSLLPDWLGGIDAGLTLPGTTPDAPAIGVPSPAAQPQAQGNGVALPGSLLWGTPKAESAARSGATGLGGSSPAPGSGGRGLYPGGQSGCEPHSSSLRGQSGQPKRHASR